MSNKNIKGYAFEWFVRKILNQCGFSSVVPDEKIIFQHGRNVMIHGLGQPHNADVLVDPPLQIPFFFPSRLIVECKCTSDELGIEHGRNVFGLREDVNNFEVLTLEMLQNRTNYRRKNQVIYNFDRYYYQVALASTAGFKITTQEFAAVHRIPLLQFKSKIFSHVVELIYNLDNVWMCPCDKETLLDAFSDGDDIVIQAEKHSFEEELATWTEKFSEACNEIARRMRVGILDNGSILFLIKPYCPYNDEDYYYSDGYSLHWSTKYDYWSLYEKGQEKYCFELPSELLRIWATSYEGSQQETALQLKNGYMKKITVFTKTDDGDIGIEILKLSSQFINEAIHEFESHV